MSKESNNRLHPLFVLKTINGTILNEFCEERILASLLKNQEFKNLKLGKIIVFNENEFTIKNIELEYTNKMHGDYGTPINYEGEFDNYNLKISIFLDSK